MAKNQQSGNTDGAYVVLDSSNGKGSRSSSSTQGGRSVKRNGSRVLLFPTEPSTLGRETIDRAIDRVLSRKK